MEAESELPHSVMKPD